MKNPVLNKEAELLTYLSTEEKLIILTVLNINNAIFQSTTGTWKGKHLSLELNSEKKPYYGKQHQLFFISILFLYVILFFKDKLFIDIDRLHLDGQYTNIYL